jgi:hypothetical protein
VITTLCGNIGMNDFFTEDDFLLYPNPASGKVTVNISDQRLEKIQIFNVTGELMHEHFTSEFFVTDLSNGMYFIVVQTEEHIFTGKFLKQ